MHSTHLHSLPANDLHISRERCVPDGARRSVHTCGPRGRTRTVPEHLPDPEGTQSKNDTYITTVDMTTPTIDVGNLVALKCTVVSMTVPEKTRHRKYAAEALAATIEFFNALHESKKVDIHMCRGLITSTARSLI